MLKNHFDNYRQQSTFLGSLRFKWRNASSKQKSGMKLLTAIASLICLFAIINIINQSQSKSEHQRKLQMYNPSQPSDINNTNQTPPSLIGMELVPPTTDKPYWHNQASPHQFNFIPKEQDDTTTRNIKVQDRDSGLVYTCEPNKDKSKFEQTREVTYKIIKSSPSPSSEETREQPSTPTEPQLTKPSRRSRPSKRQRRRRREEDQAKHFAHATEQLRLAEMVHGLPTDNNELARLASASSQQPHQQQYLHPLLQPSTQPPRQHQHQSSQQLQQPYQQQQYTQGHHQQPSQQPPQAFNPQQHQ